METLEFRKLLTLLDGQISEAQKVADEKARREALDQHLKLVKHQIETFVARKAQLDKLGIRAPFDLDTVLTKLEGEKAALEKQIAAPEEPSVPKSLKLSDADRQAIEHLYDEIMKVSTESFEAEERWTQFEIWATRWRVIADRAGTQIAEADGFLKMTFARIRERMHREPDGTFFINALDKNRSEDWLAQLQVKEAKLAFLIERRQRAEEAEKQSEVALVDLIEQMLIFQDAPNAENERLLRHYTRTAAKVEHLRDDIAETLAPVREKLEDEFAFLWKDGTEPEEEPAPEPERLTNIEIVMRICRKMNSKRLIGASHAPMDKVCKGFPDHDKGRAKEAIDILVKGGILRKKSTLIGNRVSLEPKMLGKIEAAIAARPMGVPIVDEWCALDAKNGDAKAP